jgi:hypothetical protein
MRGGGYMPIHGVYKHMVYQGTNFICKRDYIRRFKNYKSQNNISGIVYASNSYSIIYPYFLGNKMLHNITKNPHEKLCEFFFLIQYFLQNPSLKFQTMFFLHY